MAEKRYRSLRALYVDLEKKDNNGHISLNPAQNIAPNMKTGSYKAIYVCRKNMGDISSKERCKELPAWIPLEDFNKRVGRLYKE